MLIRSIELNNFRQFKKAFVEFSEDLSHPFTVITGDNTCGKTTLVRSFIWCLYGENNFKDKILLNQEVRDDMKIGESKEVKVTLILEHNDYTYKINRIEKFIMSHNFNLKFDTTSFSIIKIGNDGNSYVVNNGIEQKEEIDSILDSELSAFFFYEGEHNKISTILKKTNLKEAVKKITGLERSEKIQEYFNSKNTDNVIKRLKSKMDNTDIVEVQNIESKLFQAQTDRETKKEELETIENSISMLESQLDEKEEILNDNQNIYKEQKEKNKLNENLKEIIVNKDSLLKTIKDSLKGNLLINSLFAYSFYNNNLKDELSESEFLTDKSVSHISEEAIDELITRGYCLCGTKIENENDAYKHLIDQKNYVEPRNYGKQVQDFISNEEINLNFSISNMEELYKKSGSLIDNVEEIDKINERLSDIIKKIEGTIDIGEVQKEVERIKGIINNSKGKYEYINTQVLPSLDKKIDTLNKELSVLAIDSDKNKQLELCIAYAEKVYELITNKIDKEQKYIRKELEKTVNEIFSKIYTGKRKISIDDSFKVTTSLMNNTTLDHSGGLETVLNFSFVAGLIKLVKDNILNEEEKNDNNYPLIIDAPFSNVDNNHIMNITSTLPLYCNQIFMFVMNKDYTTAKNNMISKIGKKYKITKINESYSIIEEENLYV